MDKLKFKLRDRNDPVGPHKRDGEIIYIYEINDVPVIVNELIDKINELVTEVNILRGKDFEDDDPIGEIGWNNGEFYK